LRSRLAAWGFFVLLVALSTRLLASAVRRGVLLTDESPLLYHAATLAFNYFDFGSVRRGLAGSVVYLLGPDRLLGTAVFHVLCAAAVAAGAATLFLHLRLRAPARGVYVLLFIALMMRWAEDPGRSDLAVAALLVAAALAFQARKLVLSCLCVGLSLGVHETGLVFGLSLLGALLLDGGRWRQVPRRAAAFGSLVLAAFVALYVLLGMLPHADVATMAAVVRSHFPTHEYVDWAIYFAVSGSRGVHTSVCQNLGDPTYPLHLATGLGVIAIFIALLRNEGKPPLPAALLAAFPVLERRRERPVALGRPGGPQCLARGRSRRERPGGGRRRSCSSAMAVARRANRHGVARHPAHSSEDLAHPGPDLLALAGDRPRGAGSRRPENAALSRRPRALRCGLAQRARRRPGSDAEALSWLPSCEASRRDSCKAWLRPVRQQRLLSIEPIPAAMQQVFDRRLAA
jgi:hypothetical protein